MARYGRQEPVGRGGWLAVFVVTLGLLAAVGLATSGLMAEDALARTGPLTDPRMHRYLVAAVLLALMRSAGYAALAWRLIASRTRSTPRVAIAGLWLIGPGLMLVSGTKLGWVALPAIGYAASWMLYLLRSRRIANTYASTEDGLADVFG